MLSSVSTHGRLVAPGRVLYGAVLARRVMHVTLMGMRGAGLTALGYPQGRCLIAHTATPQGVPMHTQRAYRHPAEGLSRRQLLQMGLAAGLTVSALPLSGPAPLWGAEVAPPKRGGILRVRGYDPTHFDPHLTISFKTHATLSFVYSRLVRHKVGTEVQPGIFTVEPDVAERWEKLDDMTYVF